MPNPLSAGQCSVSGDASDEDRRRWVNDAVDTFAFGVAILLLVLIAIV